MLTSLKVSFQYVNVYFIDKNLMQRGDLMELNFEDIEMKHTSG